jgi:tRNA-specific 2-thiouridylase
VIAGPYAQSLYAGCILKELRISVPLAELEPEERLKLRCKMRSTQQPVPLAIHRAIPGESAPELLDVRFTEPQTGVAPGQSLVLYLDDLVVAGGIIHEKYN